MKIVKRFQLLDVRADRGAVVTADDPRDEALRVLRAWGEARRVIFDAVTAGTDPTTTQIAEHARAQLDAAALADRIAATGEASAPAPTCARCGGTKLAEARTGGAFIACPSCRGGGERR